MRTYPLDEIREAFDGIEGEIRPDGYSGRGMYGQTCAAITLRHSDDAFLFFIRLGYYGREGIEDFDYSALSGLVNASRTDSMSTGIVIYFPGWTFA
jgi:hypothetical protein